MLKITKSVSSDIDAIDKNLIQAEYSDAIINIITVYEYTLNALYKRYLGEVCNPEEYFKCKSSSKVFQFGDWVGFIRNTRFLDEVYELVNKDEGKKLKDKIIDTKYLLKHLSKVNAVRVKITHGEYKSSFNNEDEAKETVYMAKNTLSSFLKMYKLYGPGNGLPPETKPTTVGVQKLIGETQLYTSLFEVLHEHDITHLDVTYFSSKLPQTNREEIVDLYWNLVDKKIKDKQLSLRRVISVDDYDKRGIKLLWVLFNLVPKLYSSLNKNVNLSVFKTSASFLDKEVVERREVNLLNMILMYNKHNPDKGYLWAFSSHESNNQSQEYVRIHGSENIALYQKIYTNLLSGAIPLTDETIKGLLNSRGGDINQGNVKNTIEKILLKHQDELQIKDGDVSNIQEVYNCILNDDKEQDSIVW